MRQLHDLQQLQQPEQLQPLQKAPAQEPPQLLNGAGAVTVEAGKEREDQNPPRSRRHRHTNCAREPTADELPGIGTTNAEVELELRHLYWARRRRHHRNDSAQPT
jgi:hypothetical protein